MDYKSFLTKDFKTLGAQQDTRTRLKFHRLHLVMLLGTLLVVGIIGSAISLDAQANRHIDLIQNQANQRITMEISIPGAHNPAQPPAAQQTHAFANERNTESRADESAAGADSQYQWLTAKVKRGDSLAAIFKRQQLSAGDLHQIMQLGKPTQRLRNLLPGQEFKLLLDDEHNLQAIHYEISKLETLIVQRDADSFVADYHHKNVDKRSNYASAVINSSLFEAGRDAGLSNKLTMELAHIFGWDIDFALDMRKGDHFTVIYEEHFLDGEKVNEGPILAAEFVNQGNTYQAIRYTDAGGRSDYYSPDGHSMRKAFLRTPVDFRRISSRFGKRKHPVLNSIRMHKGVDYAAPRGTPIRSSGDGKIVFRGRKGGYGRTIIIQHGGRYSTLYAHMASYRKGIYVGKRVKQGQVIGYVGSSGRATGPHLHYEFRVNGAHRNPLTIRLPNAQPINAQYKQDFLSHTQTMLSQITMHKETNLALIQP